MTKNHLEATISACGCSPCRALTALRRDTGAVLKISPRLPGRMSELAVVAAAGSAGLTATQVVDRRRAYAEHLGVELDGPNKNDSDPIHIKHAIRCSNHTPDAKASDGPVNLGRARASEVNGRYFLIWEPGFVEHGVDARPASRSSAVGDEMEHTATFIEIAWPAGIERIEIDIANLSEQTEIRLTEQHIDETGEDYSYETSSTIKERPDDQFEISIAYEYTRNRHIDDSWWGTTTIILNKTDQEGVVRWADTDDKTNDCTNGFRIVSSTVLEDADRGRYSDELEINGRDDLKTTDKLLMINARRGQGVFRSKVLQIEKHCRLTGTTDRGHLRASHIKPWAVSKDNERLDGCNGLMLAPHVDHLFDKAYISFEDCGRLLVLNETVGALLNTWGIDLDRLAVPPRPFSPRQCTFLVTHRERFYRLKRNR